MYRDCFVAFIDILGFSARVDAASDSATQRVVADALKVVNSIPTGGKKVYGPGRKPRVVQLRSRAFSDNLALFLPIDPEPSDLIHLLFVIRFLQDELWKQGVCLRGGLTIGSMHWPECDDRLTFGSAFTRAAEMEKAAVQPRIAVSSELFDFMAKTGLEADQFGTDPHQRVSEFILEEEKSYFLDLLNPDVTRRQGEQIEYRDGNFSIVYENYAPSRHAEIVAAVKSVIEANIDDPKPCVQAKYNWLDSYVRRHSAG